MVSGFDANAGDLVAVADIFELRSDVTAFGYGFSAARMESAAGGRIQRTGNFPFEKNVFSVFFDQRIGDGYRRQ